MKRKTFCLFAAIAVACLSVSVLASCVGRNVGLESAEAIAERIWNLSKFRPDGFTVDVRSLEMPTEGIAVAYLATQGCHSREDLTAVVRHALEHGGYVGGWYDSVSGIYFFDSTCLFPEDQLEEALRFARANNQLAVYILSTCEEIRLDQQMPAAA